MYSCEALWKIVERHGPRDKVADTSYAEWLQDQDELRDVFMSKLAWAIPSRKAVDTIAKFIADTPTVEINADTDLWSALLQSEGCTITTTDLLGHHLHANQTGRQLYTDIILSESSTARSWILGSAQDSEPSDAVRQYMPTGGCVLSLRPDIQNTFNTAALKAALEKGVTKFILIGRNESGHSWTPDLYHQLKTNFSSVQVVGLPNWPEESDGIYMWSR